LPGDMQSKKVYFLRLCARFDRQYGRLLPPPI